MTNQEKKAYLTRYRAADDEINDLLREKERIMARLTKMTSSVSDMPHGPQQPDKLTDGVARLIELDGEIDRKVDALCKMREELRACIETVPDFTLQRILMLRYISGQTWEQIAVNTNYCYKQVCRLHGTALSKLKMSVNVLLEV